jgi:hypothetical protein
MDIRDLNASPSGVSAESQGKWILEAQKRQRKASTQNKKLTGSIMEDSPGIKGRWTRMRV